MMENKKMFISKKDMPETHLKKKVVSNIYLTNYKVPFFIYGPTVIAMSIYALFFIQTPLALFLAYFLIAIPLWTLFEYLSHRYVLHAKPKSAFWQKIVYSVHKGHHDYPNDKRFMLVGLNISIPALFIFYGLSYVALGSLCHSFMAGWVATYLFYDWLHFAVHNYNFNNKLYKVYQRHHIEHHFLDSDKNFGFITLLWDEVFKTKLNKEEKIEKMREAKR